MEDGGGAEDGEEGAPAGERLVFVEDEEGEYDEGGAGVGEALGLSGCGEETVVVGDGEEGTGEEFPCAGGEEVEAERGMAGGEPETGGEAEEGGGGCQGEPLAR